MHSRWTSPGLVPVIRTQVPASFSNCCLNWPAFVSPPIPPCGFVGCGYCWATSLFQYGHVILIVLPLWRSHTFLCPVLLYYVLTFSCPSVESDFYWRFCEEQLEVKELWKVWATTYLLFNSSCNLSVSFFPSILSLSDCSHARIYSLINALWKPVCLLGARAAGCGGRRGLVSVTPILLLLSRHVGHGSVGWERWEVL